MSGVSGSLPPGQQPGMPVALPGQQPLPGMLHADQRLQSMPMVGADGFSNGMHGLMQPAPAIPPPGIECVMPAQRSLHPMEVGAFVLRMTFCGGANSSGEKDDLQSDWPFLRRANALTQCSVLLFCLCSSSKWCKQAYCYVLILSKFFQFLPLSPTLVRLEYLEEYFQEKCLRQRQIRA